MRSPQPGTSSHAADNDGLIARVATGTTSRHRRVPSRSTRSSTRCPATPVVSVGLRKAAPTCPPPPPSLSRPVGRSVLKKTRALNPCRWGDTVIDPFTDRPSPIPSSEWLATHQRPSRPHVRGGRSPQGRRGSLRRLVSGSRPGTTTGLTGLDGGAGTTTGLASADVHRPAHDGTAPTVTRGTATQRTHSPLGEVPRRVRPCRRVRRRAALSGRSTRRPLELLAHRPAPSDIAEHQAPG